MMEAVAKVILKTNKKSVAQRNKFSSMKHGQIVDLDGDGTLEQLVLQPINKASFDNLINKWEQVARTIGSASDPALGLAPTSGTPLGTTEIVTQQGIGIHDYRQGKLATFWGEIYRDWGLDHFASEINKGSKWLDELSLEELREVADKIAVNESNRRIKKAILEGKDVTPEQQQLLISLIKEEFVKGGKKKFMEVMKDEFKNLPFDIHINIKGKQKDMFEMVTKLNNVFRTLFTPGAIEAIQQNEGLAQILNDILEYSGFSPVNFGKVTAGAPMAMPMQELPVAA
jgi:hypothetical protein